MEEELKRFTNLLHAFLCRKKHPDATPDELDNHYHGMCYSDVENNRTDRWELEDHKFWLARAGEIMKDLECSDVEKE